MLKIAASVGRSAPGQQARSNFVHYRATAFFHGSRSGIADGGNSVLSHNPRNRFVAECGNVGGCDEAVVTRRYFQSDLLDASVDKLRADIYAGLRLERLNLFYTEGAGRDPRCYMRDVLARVWVSQIVEGDLRYRLDLFDRLAKYSSQVTRARKYYGTLIWLTVTLVICDIAR